jgi:hypothetical protein
VAEIVRDKSGSALAISNKARVGDNRRMAAPTVKQPRGTGALPITLDWGPGSLIETVTATKEPWTISFKMAVQDCGIKVGCQGYFFRAANILLNGNAQAYFGTSQAAALAYFQGGVLLRGGCPIVGSDVSQIDAGDSTVCGIVQAATEGPVVSVRGDVSPTNKRTTQNWGLSTVSRRVTCG